MKRAQLLGIGIALGAGALAFVGMQLFLNRKPETIVKKETIGATEVLVASTSLQLGVVASATHFSLAQVAEGCNRRRFHNQGG